MTESADVLNVVHVTSTFPRSTGDPTGVFLADLVRAEQAAGVEVAVVAPHDSGLPGVDTVAGVDVRRFRYAPSRLEVLAYRGGLLSAARRPVALAMVPGFVFSMAVVSVLEARRRGAAVIHAHWWFPGGLAALVASRLLGRPLIITLHGSDVALARRRGWRALARAVVARAAAVTAVSDALAAEARVVFLRDDITVTAMPVPLLGEPDPASPTALRPPPPLRLVAVGRFTPEKGFDVLVMAVSLLVAEGMQVEVDLVGSGPEADKLSASYVRQVGPLAPADLHALMRGAHAIVVPSRREGLGLVAVEALALGRPVVASRVGGLVETLAGGRAGLLVPPDDPEALACALRNLPVGSPETGHLLRHRPDVVAAQHLGLYREASQAPIPRRWRPLRWFGVAVALAVLAVLVRLVVQDWPVVRHAWRHPDGSALAVAVAAVICSEVGFGLSSARALRAVSSSSLSMFRAASVFWVSQTAKNIPGGIWTALARAGLARQWGIGPRTTLAWLSIEGVAASAAGTLVGAVALAVAAVSGSAGLPLAAWILLAVGAVLSPLSLAAGSPFTHLLIRVAGISPTPGQVGRAAINYIPVWMVGGVAFAALCRTVVPLSDHDMLLAGGAACIATVAGFLAVPVPSGIGVREAVLVALLHLVMPTALAISVTLGSRVLAILVQTALAGIALPVTRGGRPVELPDQVASE